MKDDEPPNLPDLHRRCQQALTAHAMTKQLCIVVENDDGVVVLRGRVRTYYAKQMAQEVIRHLLKTYTPHPVLRNQIDVLKGD